MNEFNPYAAPASSAIDASPGGDDGTFWRDGDELLVRPGADLPKYCVKCGRPAREYRQRVFYWHSPWLYLLILLHMFIYVIVAVIVRKPAAHRVGLCLEHGRRRRNFVVMAWLSLVPLAAGFLAGGAAMISLGMLAFVVLLLWGLLGMRILNPRRIDTELAVYRGAATAFLARLPRYPYRRG